MKNVYGSYWNNTKKELKGKVKLGEGIVFVVEQSSYFYYYAYKFRDKSKQLLKFCGYLCKYDILKILPEVG